MICRRLRAADVVLVRSCSGTDETTNNAVCSELLPSGCRSSPASSCWRSAATERAQLARWVALVGVDRSASWSRIPLYTRLRRRHARRCSSSRSAPWIARFNIHYHLGVDGISLLFVLLNSFITVAGRDRRLGGDRRARRRSTWRAFLILSGLMIGVFAALDALLFYVFFEATLIPMFLIIGVWGGPQPRVRGGQVLPLHAARLAADAGRAASTCTTSRAAASRSSTGTSCRSRSTAQMLLFFALPARVRGQGADVAGAHLAAGRARRGADRRLGGPGRDHAEARRLRLPALHRCRSLPDASPRARLARSSRCR